MLLSRKSKTVFENKIGAYNFNFPKEAVKRFGKNYIFDLYEDKIVMYPVENLGKVEE